MGFRLLPMQKPHLSGCFLRCKTVLGARASPKESLPQGRNHGKTKELSREVVMKDIFRKPLPQVAILLNRMLGGKRPRTQLSAWFDLSVHAQPKSGQTFQMAKD